MSEEVKLDWSAAEVQDGKLAIALRGKPPKAWKGAFQRAAHLLNRGKWEEVTLKKGKIFLQPITPGDEDRVRHFLESVVLQANSAIKTTDESNAERSDETDGATEEEAATDPKDREITEHLRSFAETDADS